MMAVTHILPLFVILPLAGAFFIAVVGKRNRRMPDVLGNLATASLFLVSLASVPIAYRYGVLVYSVGAWQPPVGIAMVLDGLTSFMLLTVNLVAFAVTIYSIDYMERFTSKWKFYTLFLLMLAPIGP